MIRVLFQNAAALTLFLWAMKRCGAPEKILSSALLVALWTNLIARWLLGYQTHFATFDPMSMAIDGALLVTAVGLSLRSNRTWPLWFAALQLLAVCAHILRPFDVNKVHALSYVILSRMPTYAQLLVLLCAMTAFENRRRHGIQATDWEH
ncbi:hypothetical protein ACOYW6_07725 [Parablastomonas sp. CN1-191]|uniref:hypothetical protein n=1 Tax=Parablastomonas sp. CN1-191 TaxID=3400908 RepID=UPI003BF89787